MTHNLYFSEHILTLRVQTKWQDNNLKETKAENVKVYSICSYKKIVQSLHFR